MKVLKKLKNYLFYCGIEREEYNAVKKDVYASNFVIWRILHFFMAAVFLALYISSLMNGLLHVNRYFYLAAFLYSSAGIVYFFVLRKDSRVAKLLMYLSMSLLLAFGCFISRNNPVAPATTFIALLLITPMFMIDRPVYMTMELCAASTVFLIWMHSVKSHDIWMVDLINVIIFTIVGIFLNIIANAVRIREFVLTRKINIQKDTDELTGLKNKASLTREINAILKSDAADKGAIFVIDVDKFKSINDTFGHDVGDSVIEQLGKYLATMFIRDEIVGRFGGDEFIIFIKGTNEKDAIRRIATDVIAGASEQVTLPDADKKVSISIGGAICDGLEKDYSEIFKKADTALYRSKADPDNRFCMYE